MHVYRGLSSDNLFTHSLTVLATCSVLQPTYSHSSRANAKCDHTHSIYAVSHIHSCQAGSKARTKKAMEGEYWKFLVYVAHFSALILRFIQCHFSLSLSCHQHFTLFYSNLLLVLLSLDYQKWSYDYESLELVLKATLALMSTEQSRLCKAWANNY